MVTVDVDDGSLQADSQPKSVDLIWGVGGHLALSLHASYEPSELLQWPSHDNSIVSGADIAVGSALYAPCVLRLACSVYAPFRAYVSQFADYEETELSSALDAIPMVIILTLSLSIQ